MVVWAETEAVERVFKRHAVVKLVMVVQEAHVKGPGGNTYSVHHTHIDRRKEGCAHRSREG